MVGSFHRQHARARRRGVTSALLLAMAGVMAIGGPPAGAAPSTKTAPAAKGALADYDLSTHNLPEAGGSVTFTATDVTDATKGCQLTVGGFTSLLESVTVKGVAVTGTPVRHGKRSATAFSIAQNAACPKSVSATAAVARNPNPFRAHLDFTLALYYTAVHKGHRSVTALRSFGARSVGVAALPDVSVRDVAARPATLTNWSGAAVSVPHVQLTAIVTNAAQCTVSTQLVDASGTPATAVSNLDDFKGIAPVSGSGVDCTSATTAPVRVATAILVPAITLARHATCGSVKLKVTWEAQGNGPPRAAHTWVNVDSGRSHC